MSPLAPRRPNHPVVYSTGAGRVCPVCSRPVGQCGCGKSRQVPSPPKPDGIVRVQRDRKGRRGKTMTVITGVPLGGEQLEELAATLKRFCGAGGTARDGAIEVQGDHRDQIAAKLTEMG